MRDGAKRIRGFQRRARIYASFGIFAVVIFSIVAICSRTKLVSTHTEDAIQFHMIIDREFSEQELHSKFLKFSLHPCILHIYSTNPMKIYSSGIKCPVKRHRLRVGATWADIPLSSDGRDIIIRDRNFRVTDDKVQWIESARGSVHALEMAGSRHNIAAFIVPCHDGSPCAVSPHADRDGISLWKDFQEWYTAHRSEWRIWPHITKAYNTTPRFRRSRSNKKRDPNLTHVGQLVGHIYLDTSATWQMWFDRWIANYSLHTVIREGNDLKALSGMAWNRNEFVADEGGEAYMEALRDVVFAASNGRRVAMTIVDSAFQDLTKSWLCNVRTGGFLPSGIVWLTLSEDIKSMLDSTGIGTTVDLTGALKQSDELMPNILYGHKTYWKLMLLRTRLIADLVERGVEVFLFETDQTWLKDPLVYIDRELSAGADMVGTLDTQHNVAGNTLYLKPTLPTRKLWAEVYRRFRESYDDIGVESMKESESSFVQHDQHSLSDLLLYNEEFRREYPVALGLLNADLFVGGSWYSGFYESEESKTPVIINNNFISGVGRKKKRAIEFGHWFIDRNGRCMPDIVHKALRYEFPNGLPIQTG